MESGVTLDVEKFGMAVAISDPLLRDMRFDVYQHVAHRVVRAWQEILCQKIEKIEADYPADWWQAFKERFLPAWGKRRWPVRKIHLELVARALYPEIAIPDHGRLYLHKTVSSWSADEEAK